MTKNYPGEQWKNVHFPFEFTNDFRLEVSNFGRIRTFNKLSDGNIINGSMVNGYRIIRLKLFRERPAETQARLAELRHRIVVLNKKIIIQKEKNRSTATTIRQLSVVKKKLAIAVHNDAKTRTIHYHALIHRLVAEYFLRKPAAGKTIVGHLDFNKLNNRVTNLKWMTPEENYEHQKSSPYVIEEKLQRKNRDSNSTNAAKLTTTRVMLLKKMLNQGKPIRQLVKQFKVTDTQILRIKRGENWSNVPAAT